MIPHKKFVKLGEVKTVYSKNEKDEGGGAESKHFETKVRFSCETKYKSTTNEKSKQTEKIVKI